MTSDHVAAVRTARIAFAGAILGAVIGGLGSFAGAYFTYTTQADETAHEQRQSSYVEVLTASSDLAVLLEEAAYAIEIGNQARYAELRQSILDKESALYSSAVKLNLIADQHDRVDPMIAAFFEPEFHEKIEDCDPASFRRAAEEGRQKIGDLEAAAREDLQAD